MVSKMVPLERHGPLQEEERAQRRGSPVAFKKIKRVDQDCQGGIGSDSKASRRHDFRRT